MKKIFTSILAIALTAAANAANFTGTYNDCDVTIDYPLNADLVGENPTTVNANVTLSDDTENDGKFALSINGFQFLDQTLNIAVNNLMASETEDGNAFETNFEYVAGPDALVAGNPVSTVLKITVCKVENQILDVDLTVYIGGATYFDESTGVFNIEEWLLGLEVTDEEEAYNNGGIVFVSVNSNDAANFVPDHTGIFAPKADALNIAVAANEITVAGAEGKAYAIFNAIGGKVAEGVVANNIVNISDLANGAYFITVGNAAAKFVKE